MRRGALLAVVTVALSLAVESASAQEVATLAVDPPSLAIELEDGQFTLRITVDDVTADEGLGGYALVVSYDPDVIEALSVSDAGLFEGSENPALCPSSAIDNDEGILGHFCLSVPIIPQPGPRPTEPQVLAEVTFAPVAEGFAVIDISQTEILDPAGNELESTSVNGEVTVGEGILEPAPTPTAVAEGGEDAGDGGGNAFLWVGLGIGLAVVAVVALGVFVSLRRRSEA